MSELLSIVALQSAKKAIIAGLQERRTKLKLTLEQVGEKVTQLSEGACTLSVPQLSRLENLRAEPSVEQLYYWRHALAMGQAELEATVFSALPVFAFAGDQKVDSADLQFLAKMQEALGRPISLSEIPRMLSMK